MLLWLQYLIIMASELIQVENGFKITNKYLVARCGNCGRRDLIHNMCSIQATPGSVLEWATEKNPVLIDEPKCVKCRSGYILVEGGD